MAEKIEIPVTELEISVDDVFKAQGAKPEIIRARRPTIVDLTATAIELGAKQVQACGWLIELPVLKVQHDRLMLADNQTLTGELVMKKLAGSTSVYYAIGTIGAGLEQFAAQKLQEESDLSYTLDAVGSVFAEKTGKYLEGIIRQRVEEQRKSISIALSPGLIGWPVEVGQPQVFGALQPDPVLVRLLPSAQMNPRKSVSFIMGVGCPDNGGTQCDYCDLRDRCQSRVTNS